MAQGKRKHPRIPVDRVFGRQVEIYRSNSSGDTEDRLTGVVNNLSTGGVLIVVDAPLKLKDHLTVVFRFAGPLEAHRAFGQIVWISGPGFQKVCGLQFKNLFSDTTHALQKISLDYKSCETRIDFRLGEICRRDCAYWSICTKPMKLPSETDTPAPPSPKKPDDDVFDWTGHTTD